jgi:hypothetical protein
VYDQCDKGLMVLNVQFVENTETIQSVALKNVRNNGSWSELAVSEFFGS